MRLKSDDINFFIAAATVFALDLATKITVRANLEHGESVAILPFLDFTHLSNTGAGFGILQNHNMVLLWIGIIVTGLILYTYGEYKGRDSIWIGIVLGGIVGNIFDRLLYGAVTDFMDFKIWPVFNIADSALTVGIIMMIIRAFQK